MNDSNNGTVSQLGALHGLLARHLADKLVSGDCSPADLNVIRQFLRDNNIECLGENNDDIQSIVKELPFNELPARPN